MTDDAPLLPGDWGAVEDDAARRNRARQESAVTSRRLELVREFGEWLRDEEYEPDGVSASTRMIGGLLRFKAESLNSPDPQEWSAELIVALLTEVVPREFQEGLNDPRDAASELLLFVSFLDATRRWRKRPLPSHEARALLVEIAFPDPEDWGPGIPLARS